MNLYLALGVAGAIFASGIATDRMTPVIGANARIQHFKAESAAWRKKADDWVAYGKAEKAAFAESERLRRTENSRAVEALNEAGQVCSVRVARARASAVAIHAIVTKEPRRDPQGCPLRELVPARELRDALTPTVR